MSNLHRAVRMGQYDQVKKCLDEGMDPNSISVHDLTPLMIAAQEGFLEISCLLLQSHADPNIQRKNGTTVLHLAAGKDRIEIVQLLLESQANPDVIDKFSHTAAIWAAMASRNETVELLRRSGADMTVRDREGKTADDWIEIGGVFGQAQQLFPDHFGVRGGIGELLMAGSQAVEAVRKQMSEGLSADEYAAKHGRNILIYGYGLDRFEDIELESFAHRVWEILSTPGLLVEVEERYLHGQELDDARKHRANLNRARERRQKRDSRMAITSKPTP